jgi:hypothetical protein
MNDFNFFERISFFHKGVYYQVRQGMPMNQAIGFSFEDSWRYPEEDNKLSNFVILIEYINTELCLYKRIDKRSVELFKNLQEEVMKIDLKSYMSEYELEVFNGCLMVLNADLKVYPIV